MAAVALIRRQDWIEKAYLEKDSAAKELYQLSQTLENKPTAAIVLNRTSGKKPQFDFNPLSNSLNLVLQPSPHQKFQNLSKRFEELHENRESSVRDHSKDMLELNFKNNRNLFKFLALAYRAGALKKEDLENINESLNKPEKPELSQNKNSAASLKPSFAMRS